MEVTDLHADTATDTGRLIDVMGLTAFAGDRFNRAVACTDRTACTNGLLDFHADQRSANFRWAALLINMRFIFMAEVFERAKDRRRRALTESAKAVARDFKA